jgi:nicotinate-nucleotide pyrophosphorylase (carboxylating)
MPTNSSKSSQGRIELEASGNIEQDRLVEIAATGVDFISIGALTKNLKAIDFSLRYR